MLRRSHKKSRNGCIECKRRHRKCDETRPGCVVCSTANIQCSYSASQRASPEPVHGMHINFQQELPRASASPSISLSATQSSLLPGPSRTPYVNIVHMQLFFNISDGVGEIFGLDPSQLNEIPRDVIIRQALSAPYLMNELLALSALHLSMKNSDTAEVFRNESTTLQNEALRLFNVEVKEVNEGNIVPAFLFSGTLSIHFFCDTFATRSYTLDHFLDQLVQSIRLFRGIRVMLTGLWDFLLTTEIKSLLRFDRDYIDTDDEISKQFEKLGGEIVSMIGANKAEAGVCSEAIRSLIWVYKCQVVSTKELGFRGPRKITAWPTLLSAEYTELLVQRRPEALIILGYFSVLLHMCRYFWAIGNAGQILLGALEAYLPDQWRSWLEWPRMMISK